MKAAARSRRDRIRAQLADLKMPGALEALDEVLTFDDPRPGQPAAPSSRSRSPTARTPSPNSLGYVQP